MMGVRILHDSQENMAALYCSTSDWAFGPVFYGDAQAKAESFCDWFNTGKALEAAKRLGVDTRPVFRAYGFERGYDPREYDDADLERLYGEWRNYALDDNGDLRPEPQSLRA